MDLNEARKRLPELAVLSDESALNVIHQVYYPNMDKAVLADRLGYKMPAPPVPERSMLRAAGDLGLQVAGGAVSGVRMMTDLAGADNAVSTGLRSAEDALRELQSAAAKADQQRIAEIMKEAENKGFGEQVVAGVRAFGQAPAAMVAQAIGTSLPTLATALIPGVGQGAMAARLAAGAGIGAAQGAGNIKGVIYDEVMQNPLPGETPEQTKARAQNAQAYSGPNTGQIMLGGGLGGLAGSTGMERTLAGLRNGVTQAAPSMVGRVGMAAAAEAVPEIAQGGQEKMASNLALRNEGFDVDPMAGVAASATMEGLAGGITGGLAGIPNPPVQAKEPVPQPVQPPQPLPETGPMTRAVNAGLGPRITNTLTADLLGRSADPLAGQITAERQAAEDSALMRNQFADRNAASLAGGGLEGSRADPLANMLAEARTTDANAFTNVQQVANSRPPMPASDAARILEEAKARGMDMTAAPHPEGGFVVVPRQWVTPDMAAQAESEIADTLARMQQADAAPVERAERRRSEPVDLNLNTDPVAGYIEDLRNTNTPAARAYVGEFDAGRVTREDVEQRMQADRGLTADERLAKAAAEGLKLNPKGDPFKTLMAAQRAAKTTPGTVIEVPGGYAIRTRSSSYADTQAQDAAPAEASVEPAGNAGNAAPAVRSAGVPGVDQPQPLDALTDEQDAPQATTGAPATTEAPTTGAETPTKTRQKPDIGAPPVEAPEAARGDGAAAAGVPDAGAGAGVRADGVNADVPEAAFGDMTPDLSKNPQELNTSAEPAQKTAESEQVKPFEHAGLKVQPSRVKEGDQVVDRWVVQSPENAEREARGERQIGGDRIVETREQAIKTAEQEAKRYAKEKADRAEIDAQDKARRDADEAKKEANRGKTLLERRADAILDKPGKFPASAGLGPGTKREAMDKAIEQGRLVTEVMVDDTAAKKRDQDAVDAVRRAGYILGASNENIPVVKRGLEAQARLKEGKYQKPEYRVYQGSDRNGSFFEITKTEYDYVQKVKANPPTESKPDQETKAKAEPKAENLPEGWDTLKNGYTGLPVYRFNQGAGQPFAVVTRTEIGYEVQIRHGDKLVTSRNMRGYATGEALDIATQMLGEASMATHKDPGEKAEPATKAVVNEAIKTAAKNEDTKPSEMRKWLLGEIDKALLQAPDRADYDDAVKRMGEKDAVSMFTGNGFLGKNAETGFVTFDVPGDGKFKVRNSTRGLLEFRKNVSASLGFKDSGQKTVKPEQNEGVRSGSGGQMAAITNMIEEGDFEAARDYAEAVGIKLEDVKVPRGERKPQWDQFLKDGTVPPPPDTRPLPPQRTPAQIAEDERLAKEAEAKKPNDTGWNMAGTGYGGKRYRGRNITTADGREIVARVYENAGNYDEVEVKVDGVRKFTVRDSYNAQDKADAFVKTLTEQEVGPFGPILTQYRGDAQGAIKALTELKNGEAVAALSHPDVGEIDLVWGEPPEGKREGFGLAKISMKHPEVLGDLQGFISGLTKDQKRSGANRVRLVDATGEAVVSLDWKGDRKVWLLTAYEKGAEAGTTMDTASNGSEGDTARLGPGAAQSLPQPPAGYKPAGEPFYRGGKLTQGYAPFAPGERVTMKDSAGQSGVVESFASPDDAGVFASAVVKFDNGVEQMVPLGKLQAATAPAQTQAAEPEAETPRLTPAEAAELMEWQSLGTKDGVTKHILTFYESKANKDAKRGRMIVATVTKGDRSATAWMVDGDDQTFGPLSLAKKRGMEIGMAKAVSDGFVDAATPAAPAQQEAQQATDDRDTFTLQRLNRETGRMEPVTFKRGEYVEVTLIGSDKKDYGEIDGISQARREFSVNGLWHTMAAAYKAERPAAPVRKDMAPLSSVIDKMNAKNGEGLTEADRVPEQKPASKTPTVDRHEALMKSVREGKATAEQFKAAFESLVANKDAVLAELDTKTKAELLKAGGYFIQMRYASEKKGEVIDAIYRQMVSGFVLGDTLSYGMGKGAFEAAVRRHVEATDDAKLEQYAKDRKAAMEAAKAERAAKAAAMENPQTRADFKAIIAKHIGEGKSAKDAFLALTPEQRIRYDTLAAESTKDEREARKRAAKTEVRAAGQTTGGEIIATKHTRDGYDLFVVKLADRLSKEDYNTVLASAKRLGGWYSSFRGNGAIPGFQFKDKANAEAFLKLAGGDTADAQAQAEQRRDAFEDDRSQTAAERLRTMADKLTEQAAEIENAERKTNTARRARFAASALNGAAEMKAKASTMRNIAQALEDGKAKFLDAVRTKSQVDFLAGMVATAKNNELRAKYPSYADQEKRKGEPATAETADFVEFPVYTAFRSDLATLGRQMLEVEGAKKLGQRLMSVADDVSDAYMEFAKEPGNLFKLSTFSIKRGDEVKEAIFPSREQAERAIARSGLTGKAIVLAVKRGVNRIIMSPSEAINAGIWTGDGDKRITLSADFGAELVEAIGRRGNKANKLTVPWQFQNTYDRRKALSRMGIETASEYRSALREFIGLQERAIANKVREMELQMVGRKADGLDFFPTPAEIADQMIEAAEITPDMAVLEPSAGMGHIADRIREAGAEPDVIEISPERRELLQEKGYHLAETDDFMAMQPRKFFTYGDVFRAPDGTEGVMQGSGGMGSRRVVLRPLIDGVEVDYKRGQWYDRDELVGVRHRGSWSGYDRIIMNPPFSNRRDAEHVMHAYTLLKPGGRIVAIMGEGVFFGQDKKAQEFRDWLESVGGTSEKLPPGSFMDPSLPVNTGVSARMVVIDKPAGNQTAGDVPAFSRSTANPAGISKKTAADVVDAIRSRWANAPEVVVVSGMQDQAVPQRVRDADLEQRSMGATGEPEGFWYGGKVYIVASALKSPRDVIRVLFHESLGHYGLQGVFGDGLKPILQQIAALRRAEVVAKAREYGLVRLNADGSPSVDVDNATDKEVWAAMDEQHKLYAAEEVLAVMAQTKPEMGYVKRALAAIRAWLRKNVPGFQDMKLTDGEIIQQYILPARRFVESGPGGGPRGGQPVPALSRTQDQTQTPEFKRWYGDWETGASDARGLFNGRRNQDVNAVQRRGGVEKNSDRTTRVGNYTFSGASGPVGADGKPVVFFHGTREDFSVFELNHPLRHDKGWLGRGVYVASDALDAESYASMRRGTGSPNVMPLYVSVKNPYLATNELKKKLRRATQESIDKFTQDLKDQGYDGVVMPFEDGHIELMAFEPAQVKSAIGNNGQFDPDNADIRFSRTSLSETYADLIPQQLQDRLADMTTSQRGFNRWWHGTVGTQLHKAKVNKEFGKVYYAVQDFMKDVSRMATLAADKAPDLLPQIDSLDDVKKVLPQMGIAGHRQRKADMKAASDALFDGTLRYTRDGYGQPVEAENETDAGIVWTDEELRDRGLNDEAIKLYRQARSAINQSLDNLMAADVYRMLTAANPESLADNPQEHAVLMAKIRKAAASDRPLKVLELAGVALDRQAEVLRKQVASLKKQMDEAYIDGMNEAYTQAKDALKTIEGLKERMEDKYERVSTLKSNGYAPLMRFGRYAVDVLDEDGNRAFFGLYETQYAANRAARRFAEQGFRVSQSVKSAKEFELLKGISPETAMLFAELLGVEKDEAMQKWLQNAVAEQSALKRQIRRKGIAGFDDDAGRVVAAFLTSNARAASRALHGLRIQERVENVRAGDVKDEAIKLAEYVNNPQEEAQAIRSLLFFNYIGGSVASALVNLTQTVVQTFPYLAQFGGARKGASRVGKAMKLAMGKIEDAELAAAVKRAEQDGVIKPQEVFQLQAEASRTLGSNLYARTGLALWGSFFQMAEQFNRRVAFIAAYQTAKEEGMRNPFAFAENAVDETQGTFNKGNRPNWGRGAIGATLFTFKTFTVQYVEFLKRLPPKERALALGVLVLLAGFRGLPFAEDAEDVVDTVAQSLGYNFTTKEQMDRFLVATLGKPFADFLQHGASGTGLLPFDVSQRLGMADLLPATGVLKPSETRKDEQILEVFGVAGGFVRDALKKTWTPTSVAELSNTAWAPVAIRNAAKAIEMYDRGIYTDSRGRKVMDVSPVDAAMKGIGLQPAGVAEESRKAGSVYEMRALFAKTKAEITEQMALGQFENDKAKIQKARERLADWNAKNPEAQIVLSGQAVRRRVTEMRKDRADRLVRSTPRELRAQAAETME